MSTSGLVPRGPWTDRREVERVIGPVEKTLRTPAWQYLVFTGFFGAMATVAWFVPGSPTMTVVSVILGLVACSGLVSAWRERRDGLLVGDRGLAEWRAGGATILLWDDLGVSWHVLPSEFDDPPSVGDVAVMLLEHDNGTRLRLRKVYPGIQAVRKRVSDHLQRNQLARAEAILEGRADPLLDLPVEEAPPDEPWPTIVPGPWSQEPAVRGIAPILLAAAPTPESADRLRRAARLGFILALVKAAAALLGAVALLVVIIILGRPDEWFAVLVFFGAGVWIGVHAYTFYKARLRLLWSFLLLGERGVALWTPWLVRVVLWDDLGIDWRACSELRARDLNEAQLPILLKLQHADGALFYITELYDNAGRLVAHVRRELRRAQEAARRAREQRAPALLPEGIQVPAPVTATPRTVPDPAQPETPAPAEGEVPPAAQHPAAWADTEEVRAIGAVDFVCRPTWGSCIQMGCGSIMAAGAGVGAMSFFVFLGNLIGMPRELFFVVGLGVVFWWFVLIAFLVRGMRRDLSACWLVGAHGVVFWNGTRVVAIRWDEIGTVWRVVFPSQTNPAAPSFRTPVVFTSADGTDVAVTIDFTNVPKLMARVREEVGRRLGDSARMLRPRQADET
jgi:hypothetical protein